MLRRTTTVMLAAALALSACSHGHKRAKKPKTLGDRISVLNYEQRVEAEPELADVPVELPPPAVNADWTQPGGAPAKTLGHLALPENPHQAWSVSIGRGSTGIQRLNASPVVAGGRVYTMDVEAQVSAFDAADGHLIWRTRIARKREGVLPAFGGGVSVLGDKLFATTGFGVLAALSTADGHEVWRKEFAAVLRAAPTVAGNRVYVRTLDSQLLALDVADGKQAWEVNATLEPAAILGSGAPAVAQDTVVAGFSSGELFALRVENGRTVWQDALARTGRTTAMAALSDIDASPVIDRGRVFAIGNGGRMAALELATGTRVWERNFAGGSTPWVAGEYLFAVTIDGELVCMTRTDGKIRWVTKLPRWKDAKRKSGAIYWTGPVLASDRLLLVSSDRQLVSVSPYTGKTLSEVPLKAAGLLPPVVANNALYILTDDGRLTAYR